MRGEELGNSSELGAFGGEAKNSGGEQKWSLAAQEKGTPPPPGHWREQSSDM